MKITLGCKRLFGPFSTLLAPKFGALSLGILALSFAVGCQTPVYSEISDPEDADPDRAKRAKRALPIPASDKNAPQSAPLSANESGMEAGTCRPASTFRSITGEAANPNACRDICRNLMNCMAFTYMAEPAPGEGARCDLKHSIPDAVADSEASPQGCVSWVNPRASAQLARMEAEGLEMRSVRPGENLREFEMDQPDPALCKKACENLMDCAAFTYTRPGYDGEQARCALKTQAEAPITDQDCCISGTK